MMESSNQNGPAGAFIEDDSFRVARCDHPLHRFLRNAERCCCGRVSYREAFPESAAERRWLDGKGPQPTMEDVR